MDRFVCRVVVGVAADLVAFAISDAIIKKMKSKRKKVIVDTVSYTIG